MLPSHVVVQNLFSRDHRSKPKHRCPCWQRLASSVFFGVIAMWGLSLAGIMPPVAATEAVGFTKDCLGFAQDPLLGPLSTGTAGPEAPQQIRAWSAIVPRLVMHGTALATYDPQPSLPTAPSLEKVFGVAPGSHRQIVETTFDQEGHAVVLHPQVLATVAHALTPDVVDVHVPPHARVQTVPLRVTSMTVMAHTGAEPEGVMTSTAHINEPYDLALMQADTNHRLSPLPFPAVLSYGTGAPDQPVGGIQAGDCVATIITSSHDNTPQRGTHRLVLGKVLARVPVATNHLTQTKLNVNMFTTDLAVQPGDSGSPVLALRAGQPVLVGLVSATMYPTALFTYVARIDPLLAMVEALRLVATPLRAKAGATPGPGEPGDRTRLP